MHWHGHTAAWIIAVAQRYMAADLPKLNEPRPFERADEARAVHLG